MRSESHYSANRDGVLLVRHIVPGEVGYVVHPAPSRLSLSRPKFQLTFFQLLINMDLGFDLGQMFLVREIADFHKIKLKLLSVSYLFPMKLDLGFDYREMLCGFV